MATKSPLEKKIANLREAAAVQCGDVLSRGFLQQPLVNMKNHMTS